MFAIICATLFFEIINNIFRQNMRLVTSPVSPAWTINIAPATKYRGIRKVLYEG